MTRRVVLASGELCVLSRRLRSKIVNPVALWQLKSQSVVAGAVPACARLGAAVTDGCGSAWTSRSQGRGVQLLCPMKL